VNNKKLNVHSLSYNQKSLWYLYKLAPKSSAYNTAFATRIVSDINIDLLSSSFRKLFDRHEVLRSTYDTIDGVPFMKINESIKLPFELIDAADWNEKELSYRVSMQYSKPFDLENGPVARIHLFRHSPSDHILLITIHHIACDAWSFGILLNEFQKIYSRKEENSLPIIKKQYIDYISDQTEMINGPRGHQLWTFWEKQLDGDKLGLNLPLDKARPLVQNYNGSTCYFSIDGQLYEKIKQLAKDQWVTLYMLLLAGFQILLMRYTGQEEIYVGSPMANRSMEYKGVVGYFINMGVMLGNLVGNPSFVEFLQRTRNMVLRVLRNQGYPFALLVEKLNPIRDSSRSQIFEVMFNLVDRQTTGMNVDFWLKSSSLSIDDSTTIFSGMKIKPFPLNQQEGQFDLQVDICNTGRSLDGVFKYRTDLFEHDTIKRMTDNYLFLLEGLTSNPNLKVWDIPVITKTEQDRLLFEWNDTWNDFPREACLHNIFQSQVEKTPEKIAVVHGGSHLTYKELNKRANKLGNYLRESYIGPDKLVGIYMDRSIETMIGLFGILKAGGAYVPLDPDYPKERLAYMMEDAGIEVVLTQDKFKEEIPNNRVKIILIDKDWDKIQRYNDINFDIPMSPENLAYVIYTSGSTGKPKGVQIPHRAVVNLLLSMKDRPGFREDDALLAVTTLSFDIHVLELFLPLIAGGKTIIVSKEVSTDGLKLINELKDSGATVMQATPATWRLLLASEWEGSKTLKILCGGEAFPQDLARDLIKKAQSVWNMYGPTETTVWSTCFKISDADSYIPIGRPIANTSLYVLDKQHSPVPIGVSGELYIGGDGVTQGYLNRPELTAERFMQDVFRKDPKARMYRTGDLVRYHSDGNVEYLNRLDNQVKIRGFRIELGEIEARLTEYESVVQGVVVVQEVRPGDSRLTAYIMTVPGKTVTSTELRSYLRGMLPEYMIPQHFIELEKFPLTPAGKIDRKNLAKRNDIKVAVEDNYVAPRNDMEDLLSKIWKEVLGVDKVSVHDNFFEIGGHSLLAMQAIERIRKLSGVRLNPQVMLLNTLSQIANEVMLSQEEYKSLPMKNYLFGLKHKLKSVWQRFKYEKSTAPSGNN
jgi:amino acid adenylation domain-containing protein